MAEDLLDDASIADGAMAANATIADGVVAANATITDGVVAANATITDRVVAANERVEQVAANAQLTLAATAKAAKAAHAREARKVRLLDKAQTAMLKYHFTIESLSDGTWLDLLKWVVTAARKKSPVMEYTTKEAILAKFVTLERVCISYIPPWAAVVDVPVLPV